MISPEYMAGLFDGEGCITIRRVSGASKSIRTTREWRFQAYAEITIREEWILEECRNLVGGGSLTPLRNRNPKHSQYYHLMWSGAALRKFILAMDSKLKLKHKHLQVIKEMSDIKSKTMNQPTKDVDYDRQVELFNLLKSLNKKGVGKTND